MQKIIGQFINGANECIEGNPHLDIINPATSESIASVQFADNSQCEKALLSASDAFTSWSNTPPLKRARVLFKFKTLLEHHLDDLAELITKEHGKTFDDAKGEVQRAIEVVELNTSIPSMLRGDYSEDVGPHIDAHTMRQALGVCAGVSPFNFPVMVPCWMMIAAIACGNTFILKPSEKNPSAPMFMAKLLKEAGLPDGVLTILNGDKTIVDKLLAHPDIKAMTAVASTPVAKYIYETATANGKRAHTFGGAKNHCLVMPDANIKQAAKAISGAAFGAAGERCMALSVAVVIDDKTGDALINEVLNEISAIRVGNGMNKQVDMGPLISEVHLNKVKDYIAIGTKEGATLVTDGRKGDFDGQGFFLNPTLFDHVTEEMRIYQEEIFGPVLCIVRQDNFNSALDLINRHPFGNGTAIFTNDGFAARTFSQQVQAGMVGINVPIPVPVAYHPFGGWKQSVFGDTNMHGRESVHFYTKLKTVTSKWVKDESSQNAYVMPNTK